MHTLKILRRDLYGNFFKHSADCNSVSFALNEAIIVEIDVKLSHRQFPMTIVW